MNKDNDRRRLDKERQNARDLELWRRKQQGASYAELAEEYGMPSRSSAQRCVEREAKRQKLIADAMALGAPDHLLQQLTLDSLDCEDARTRGRPRTSWA